MTRKKAAAVVEPELEQLAEDAEPSFDDDSADAEDAQESGPWDDVEETPAVEQLYKCTGHAERFPDEPEFMLPLSAFPLKLDGTRRGVYCRRCQGRLHTAYGKRKREAARTSIAYLEAQIAKRRTELATLEEQLQVALDREDAE